ncbi:CotD family spore coat protein [Bacillus sp. JCM 19041]|uniref:CotD family spore coat protein n=1 Tax=Bacillus sp. JCM 19041 TaxID=1460637 RepID=UPI0006D044CF
MFRKHPLFEPTHHKPTHRPYQEHIEEYVVQEIQPVLTHYVTNKVYRHVHSFPHNQSAIIREKREPFPQHLQRMNRMQRPPR